MTKIVAIFLWFALLLVVQRPKTRVARATWLHRFCQALRAGIGMLVTTEGRFPDGGGSVISNHLGYPDIIVYAAVHRCVFCSKAEIRSWPFVGWMTMMAGTVFIDRGRGGSALKAKDEMMDTVAAGLPVMFFPEGTTTNGLGILPFHSGLLQQALSAEAPVTAARISYTLDQPNRAGVTVRDNVHYWGTIPLLKHLWGFCQLRGVHAHVRFADAPIVWSVEGIHRKVAAVEARDAVVGLGEDLGMEPGH